MRTTRLRWAGLAVLLLLLALSAGLLLRNRTPTPDEVPRTPEEAGGAAEALPARASRATPAPGPLQLLPAAQVVASPSPHGAFAGRVVSASTGGAIAGAELTFAPEGGGATSVRTGGDGAFSFTPAEAGRWQLASVVAEGFLPFGPAWGRSPIWLTATPGQRVEGVTIALSPEVILRGRVEDVDGKPLAGAQVEILTEAADERGLFSDETPAQTSDAQGAFQLRAIEGMELEAHLDGYQPTRTTVSPELLLARKVVLRMERAPVGSEAPPAAQRLSGVVVDADGAPLSGAQVRVISADSAWPTRYGANRTTQTDAAGRFRVEPLPEGLWDVSAHLEGHASATVHDVRSGNEALRLTLRGEDTHEGVVLEGTVRGPSGVPVPSFTLSVQRREGPLRRLAFETLMVVDAHGNYRVTGLTEGAYAVQVAAAELAPAEALLEVPASAQGPLRVDFQLREGARLTGVVLDARSKQPLENARLTVEGMGAQGALAVRFDALSDATGAFELTGLAEGEVSLHAIAEGHHSRILGGLMVRAGAPTSHRIELRPTEDGEDPRLELTGIGAAISAREDALVLGMVMPGGGAAEAGLAPGDALLAIDGQSVVELGFVQAVQRIRGPENSVVVLRVRKAGQDAITTVPVIRRRIEL